MHLLRTATLPFPAQQKQGCRSGSVATKSRKIGRIGFHIPLLHLQVFLSRIAMGALGMVALIFRTVTRDLLASRRMRSSWTLRFTATTFMKIMLQTT
ncbi:unnamed protein product [Triticum turgidum subsp. durum]|uniref:Uncharacterized protein n=1 Tax=Triticum turgidum subsp. durum TaxID=4567 RepID=A0A9R1PQN9_TRITD|nr:unnamed protein product [Triticum turgidum subsp. durum]